MKTDTATANGHAKLRPDRQVSVAPPLASDALDGAIPTAEIYEWSLTILQHVLKADKLSVLTFDAAGVMRFRAWRGLSEDYRGAVEGHSPWKPSERNPEPVLIEDAAVDPRLAGLRETVLGEGIRALAFIPLLYDGRLLGKFMIYYAAPHTFTPSELELAQAVASQTAFALERKRVEQKLSLYREIFRNSTEAIAVVDTNGAYLEQNAAHRELLGYADEEIIGQTPAIHLGHEVFGSVVQDLIRDGRCRRELTSRTKSGDVRHIELSAFALHDGERPVCYVGIKRDMTERKRAEDKIRALNEDLERKVAERTAELLQSNQELESFCYSVSHDLRAPLRSIDGFSQAILEDAAHHLDEENKGHFQRIRTATQRMAQLIDNLLDLSRLARKELARAPVDLSALVLAVARDLQRLYSDRTVELRVAPGMTVHGDPPLLRVVVQNLLENAWKFTGGTLNARVEVGATRETDRTVYFVRDNGAGFDMAYAGKLFVAFQRLHGHEEFPGTGIGLATVHRIIARHGGHVWAEGRVGQGATFYFTLP
jgi:PAS domain S-box-containing protein